MYARLSWVFGMVLPSVTMSWWLIYFEDGVVTGEDWYCEKGFVVEDEVLCTYKPQLNTPKTLNMKF